MADDTPTNDIDMSVTDTSVKDIARQVELIKQAANDFHMATGSFSEASEKLSGVVPLQLFPPGSAKMAEQSADAANRVAGSTREIARSGKNAAKSISDIGNGFKLPTKSLGNFRKMAETVFNKVSANAKRFGEILSSGTALAGLLAVEGSLGKLDEKFGVFTKVQQPLMDMQKYAMKAGMGMSESFREAQGHVKDLQQSFGETIVSTRTTREDVLKVGDALKNAFTADETFKGLEKLRTGSNNMASSINLANTAILVGAAKGMDATKVAEMLSDAHLTLGESVDSAALVLGQISEASKDSGLQFSKTSEIIMNSAKSLQMWGGTVSSITPIFKSFSRALGEGRKGLVAPLVDKYVSGLKGMGLEMKALIGMTQGLGGSGGALGGALQLESLMEKGSEGMEEMSTHFINTLKQYSGGQMLTRDQALENPALVAQFTIQRKLLQQMAGVDEESANRMMGILKDINENGMAGVENGKEALNKELKAGELLKKTTTNDLLDAQLKKMGAIHTQAEKLVENTNRLIDRSGARDVIKKAQKATTRMATGKVGGIGAGKEFVSDIGLEESFNKVVMRIQGMTKQRISTDEEKGSVKRGQEAGLSAMNRLLGDLAKKRDATIKGGDGRIRGRGAAKAATQLGLGKEISTKFVRKDIKRTIDALNNEIGKLKDKGIKNLSIAEASKLDSLRGSRQQLNQMQKRKRIDLTALGSTEKYQKYDMPEKIRRRIPTVPTPGGLTQPPMPIEGMPRGRRGRNKGIKAQVDSVIEKINAKFGDETTEEKFSTLKPDAFKRAGKMGDDGLPVDAAQAATMQTRKEARKEEKETAKTRREEVEYVLKIKTEMADNTATFKPLKSDVEEIVSKMQE